MTDVKAILKNRPENIRDSEREVLNYNEILKEINQRSATAPAPSMSAILDFTVAAASLTRSR